MGAFRTAKTTAFSLRRMMSTSTPRSAEMSFTFAAPNALHYNKASVKQVDVPSFSGSITINDDHSVQIIAEEAHKVEDLDAAAAREVLAAAQADAAKAADEVAKAEAMIAVEVGEALVAAAQ